MHIISIAYIGGLFQSGPDLPIRRQKLPGYRRVRQRIAAA
jgi:hypothetical protein